MPATASADARATRQLIRQTTAALTGKVRGPDWAPDGHRVPRRHSYGDTDPRGQPWTKIGNGSVGRGLAFRESLIETADDLRVQRWREYLLAEIRRRTDERHDFALELQELQAKSPADRPISRPACYARR